MAGLLILWLGVFSTRARAQAAPCVLPPNPVAAENCLRGSAQDAWGGPDVGGLEGLPGAGSVARGHELSFLVRAKTPGRVSIEIYRLGFYAGAGARLITILKPEPERGKRETSASWPVPASALSGLYVARFLGQDGARASAPFFVLDGGAASDVLLLAPGRGTPLEELLSEVAPVARWLEANGYDVAYASYDDAAADPSLLSRRRVVVATGREERRPTAATAALAAARDRGQNLVLLTGPSGCSAPLRLAGARFDELGCEGRSPTLQRAASGARVFDAGTPLWGWGLDNRHPGGSGRAARPALQQATVDLLAGMGALPGALQPGLTPPAGGQAEATR